MIADAQHSIVRSTRERTFDITPGLKLVGQGETPHHSPELGIRHSLSIKYDNLTGSVYGGNKVRKLEYLFAQAATKGKQRIATFGAVGSNHALATALYAKQSGFDCTCFLSHQRQTSQIPDTLRVHMSIGTELVRYGGAYRQRINTLRKNLWGREVSVIPMGGSSWLGTIGFVAAGLELAAQVENREIPLPQRLYVGTGTMGTAVGIALGLAIAGLSTEIHAVRVSDRSITNRAALDRLTKKTTAMMRRLDSKVPSDLASKTRIIVRDSFFGAGYAQTTAAADRAIALAKDQLDLTLEQTYTGKTVSAIIADLENGALARHEEILYWHTYNSRPLDQQRLLPVDGQQVPAEFQRYLIGDIPSNPVRR